MSLEFVSHGDMFTYPGINIRVNPVNCAGAMGAGLAKQFREHYPDMMEAYTKMCLFYTITPGSVHEYITRDGSIVMLFATKDNWRDKSKYKYITDGLEDLRKIIAKKYNSEKYMIGLPALGCGLGGLDWDKVKPMIQNALKGFDTKIIVFEPRLSDIQGAITEFSGMYNFLSNFYPCAVTYDGLTYTNSEAAFQSAKSVDLNNRTIFTDMAPLIAKMTGRMVLLRPDWEQVKDQVMEDIVRAKFTQNEQLGKLLLATGSADLIEGNDWNDTYWGVSHGVGQNKLGKILMKIRNELR
jgi:ribA/ribD-fused uncharacterized protein